MTPLIARTTVELPVEFDTRWSRIPGVTVEGRTIGIESNEYFFRLESRTWTVISWEKVSDELLPVDETPGSAIEQTTLEYIAKNGRTTDDPAEVMRIAWDVYSFLFRAEHLPALGLEGITETHLRMLAEVSVFTALNKVEQDGRITNVGPCWFFADAAQVVFDLDEKTVGLLDEVYHGGWFNENRRIESVKAHAALGGRLVHGCQSVPDRRGGAVAPYGTPMDRFRDELAEFRDEWMTKVRSYRAV
ncbi:hypothetical protein ACFO4E_00430 [Nocardiopsis mangrovi]|uniref:Uncharacterized protein n=1 Tax=Nocardiopsis mangrovi TaxID=1179818 RepID=A0ABV9DPF6_9ACTN